MLVCCLVWFRHIIASELS